jgi:hypothetical protein
MNANTDEKKKDNKKEISFNKLQINNESPVSEKRILLGDS